jgi:hypothetical protein
MHYFTRRGPTYTRLWSFTPDVTAKEVACLVYSIKLANQQSHFLLWHFKPAQSYLHYCASQQGMFLNSSIHLIKGTYAASHRTVHLVPAW